MTDAPGFLTVTNRVRVPLAEIEFSYARSSGAGGQHVNRTNSKAVLRWNLFASAGLTPEAKERFAQSFGSRLTQAGDVIISSESHRDQARNAADCLEKLRAMLDAIARPPKVRKKTKPTYGSKMRRLDGKRADSDKKRARSKKTWD